MDILTFKDGNEAAIAIANNIAPAMRTVEIMKDAAKDQMLDREAAAIEIAKSAIAEFKQEVMQFYRAPNMPPRDQDDVLMGDNYNFGLMIAYYVKKQPFLYTIDIGLGIAERHTNYALMGSADHLATFAIGQFSSADLEWEHAACLVIDALEHIKESDLYCGGKTEFKMLDCSIGPPTQVGTMPSELLRSIIAKLSNLKVKAELWRKNEFEGIFKEIHKEKMEKFAKENAGMKEYLDATRQKE